ncbi:NAD kinase [Streptoalloteichus hindustanus]|uniref:NAD kinase n=1 Tax=Streptoalloteichus hindustanus TaxID=2017 RepID=A0A1M5LI49_STRHI|nr:NAD kinase [Streptoalloteichus hindustanus]SHG64698.1 NAD+ kinase [Streptoalloteichus hindustanus]
MTREALLVVHTGRADNLRTAEQVARRLTRAGIALRVLAEEAPDLDPSCYGRVVAHDDRAAEHAELVLALGGDGTLLRAAELARPAGVPVLGVNLGRIGFLAEADPEALDEAVAIVAGCAYHVEERMTIDVTAMLDGTVVASTWALNEASVERSSRERILDVVLEIDGRPVSAFGCDGVLVATPTGSTAYAFSAGGPVIWPLVQALLVVPSNAHALFARPLVVAPDSVVALEVDQHGHPAVLACDSRRTVELPPGSRVEIVGGEKPLKLVRLQDAPFADRLVQKFALPVQGWRGPPNHH